MLKMRAPEGLSGFSHQGHPLDIGEDGSVHVDLRHRRDLEAHGFRLWDEPPGAVPAEVVAERDSLRARAYADSERRGKAMDAAVGAMIAPLERVPTDDLERMAGEGERFLSLMIVVPEMPQERVRFVDDYAQQIACMSDEEFVRLQHDAAEKVEKDRRVAEALDPATINAEDLEIMDRPELFAFLKARGLPAGPATNTDTLRAKAREALRPAA